MAKKEQHPGAITKIIQDDLNALVYQHNAYLKGRHGGRRMCLKYRDLTGLTLIKLNLSQSEFIGCVMRNMDLSGSDFTHATLYSCDLSQSNLQDCIFIRADLRGSKLIDTITRNANFKGADLRGGGLSSDSNISQSVQYVSFRGADMTNTQLGGIMASNADFEDAKLQHADFKEADLRGANLDGANLKGANVRGAKLEGVSVEGTNLRGVDTSLLHFQVDLEGALTDHETTYQDYTQPIMDAVKNHLEWIETAGQSGRQLDLSGYDLSTLHHLRDYTLTAMRALRTNFSRLDLSRVQMQSVQMGGCDFTQTTLTDADIRGGQFKNCIFSRADFRNLMATPLYFSTHKQPCVFDFSGFRYANFQNAKLQHASFRDVDLSFADFRGADLSYADLTGARLTGAKLDDAIAEGTILP